MWFGKALRAELLEVVQPSRCLLGGCVFKDSRELIVESRELKDKSKAFNAEAQRSRRESTERESVETE